MEELYNEIIYKMSFFKCVTHGKEAIITITESGLKAETCCEAFKEEVREEIEKITRESNYNPFEEGMGGFFK